MTNEALSRRLEAHTEACVQAGMSRAHALRQLRDRYETLSLWDLTTLLIHAAVLYGTDAEWNTRLLRAGFLPIRTDETYLD